MATIKEFIVLSPDEITIDHNAFYTTREEAQAACEDYAEQFRRQGYYSTVRDGERIRISLEDLPGECEIRPIEYQQAKVRFYVNNQPGSAGQIVGYLPEEIGSTPSTRLCFIEGKLVSVNKDWPDTVGMVYAKSSHFEKALGDFYDHYDEVIVLDSEESEIMRTSDLDG